MKGLALILGPKASKGAFKGPPKGFPKGEESEPEEETEESESGGSEKEYARLASEATADGDHDAAADALVSMVKACMGSYGPSK